MNMKLKRCKFGRNWAKYASLVDEARVQKAELHLQERFGLDELRGNFLDIGSGSGVFSAAATRLGAIVTAFDYDLDSVATTNLVLNAFADSKNVKLIRQGDILDNYWISSITDSNYIYSWGVLHHTGSLWKALSQIADNAKTGCIFVTAIYNDLGEESIKWTRLKKLYVNLVPMRPLLLAYSWYKFWARQQLRSLRTGTDPFKSWREYSIDSRGMSAWFDLIDWAGGYPFEVSTPKKMEEFMSQKGWLCEAIWTNSGIGNNEFRFVKL